MNKLPKILTIGIIIFIILQTFSFLFLKLASSPTKAADDKLWKIPDLQIKIPGMEAFTQPQACKDDQTKKCPDWIAKYIAGIYRYAVGVIGILAVVVMMIGGIMWITAFGNTSRVGEAKSWIEASVTGLVLTLCSYLILAQINPELVNLKALGIGQPAVKPPEIGALVSEEDKQSDKLIRDILTAKGIEINKSACQNEKQTDCTSLAYLPNNAVLGIIKIAEGCKCKVVVTGGTEAGHQSHGPNQSIVDLRYKSSSENLPNALLENYLSLQLGVSFIPSNSMIQNNDMWIGKEQNPDKSIHYHIKFK